jgi:uncharacterized membrane protein
MTTPYPPPYPAPDHPSQQPNLYGPPRTGTSVAGMVLGICSLVLPFVGLLTAIVGLVLSIDGMQNYRAGRNTQSGRGMAIAGIWCSIVAMVIWLIVILLAMAGAFAVTGYYCDAYGCY